jgi:hypothetical protein
MFKNKCYFQKLAAGFERIRTEHSILIWDVNGNSNAPTTKIDLKTGTEQTAVKTESVIYSSHYPPQTDQSGSLSRPFSLEKPDLIKPIYETGTSESCHSLSWNPHNMYQLLAGVNSKSLKTFDIRGGFRVFFFNLIF